jgi:hypothetical protein
MVKYRSDCHPSCQRWLMYCQSLVLGFSSSIPILSVDVPLLTISQPNSKADDAHLMALPGTLVLPGSTPSTPPRSGTGALTRSWEGRDCYSGGHKITTLSIRHRETSRTARPQLPGKGAGVRWGDLVQEEGGDRCGGVVCEVSRVTLACRRDHAVDLQVRAASG